MKEIEKEKKKKSFQGKNPSKQMHGQSKREKRKNSQRGRRTSRGT